jgi:hypothetical protein
MSTKEPKRYWEPDPTDEQQGLCILNDPEKRYRCYCKWDGMIHLWFYEDEYAFNCDTREYGPEAAKTSHDDYYWCIGDIEVLDDVIARLSAIKDSAKNWYAQRGKRWPPDWDGYVHAGKTIEQATTLPEEEG